MSDIGVSGRDFVGIPYWVVSRRVVGMWSGYLIGWSRGEWWGCGRGTLLGGVVVSGWDVVGVPYWMVSR